MNENIPPPNPVPPPPRPEDMHPQPRPMPPRGPEPGIGNAVGCMIGFVLLVLTIFAAGTAGSGRNWGSSSSVTSVIVFLLGLAVASVSLFFRGYRAIFLGFIIPIGVVFLLFVVICGPMLHGLHN